MSRIDSRQFQQLLDDLEQIAPTVMKSAESEFIKSTPVRSGNARRNTKLKNDTTILANYAYAGRLDEGWSKQAPGGMTDPTIDFIEREVYRQIGRID